jgi:hypothetical protein
MSGVGSGYAVQVLELGAVVGCRHWNVQRVRRKDVVNRTFSTTAQTQYYSIQHFLLADPMVVHLHGVRPYPSPDTPVRQKNPALLAYRKVTHG